MLLYLFTGASLVCCCIAMHVYARMYDSAKGRRCICSAPLCLKAPKGLRAKPSSGLRKTHGSAVALNLNAVYMLFRHGLRALTRHAARTGCFVRPQDMAVQCSRGVQWRTKSVQGARTLMQHWKRQQPRERSLSALWAMSLMDCHGSSRPHSGQSL